MDDPAAGAPPPGTDRAGRRRPSMALGWRATLSLALAIALGLGLLLTVRLIARPLAFLVIAIAIAEALAPVVDRLQRWIPRGAAVAVVFALLLAVLGLIGWLVVPVLIAQARELIGRAPELIARVQGWTDDWDTSIGIGSLLAPLPGQLGTFLISLPMTVLGAAVNTLLVVFLAAYWLIGARAAQRFALTLVPHVRRARVEHVLHRVGQAMGGYVRGAAINAVIMGVLAWLGLTLLGIDYPIVLGVVTMLAEPVPILGPIIAAVPVVAVALLQSPTKALLALGFFTLLQQVEGNLLTPNIMRQQTDMPQTLVLFAVIAGGAMGGLLGVLAALPGAAALRVLTLEVLVPAMRRWTGAPPSDEASGETSDEKPAS